MSQPSNLILAARYLVKGVLGTIMGEPNEEPRRNKEGKTDASSLASRKAREKVATFLFSLTHN